MTRITISSEEKKKLFDLGRDQFFQLAIENNNAQAYKALLIKTDYILTSKLLSLEKELEIYFDYMFLDDGTLNRENTSLATEYHFFLLHKICTTKTNPDTPPYDPNAKISFISPALKDKFFQLKFPELKELAIAANNLSAFEVLMEKKDFAATAKLLGVSKKFKLYKATFASAGLSRRAEMLYLADEFQHYLMARICFPEEFVEPS